MAAGFCVFYGLTAGHAFWAADAPATAVAISIALGVVLIALSVIDIMTMRLPDVLTLPLIAVGVAVSTYLALDDALMRVAAAATGFLALFAIAEIFRRLRGVDALGLGDAKLFAAAGAWVGFGGLPAVLLVSSVSALAAALAMKACGVDIKRETRIPFGPFLAAGLWVVWLYGPDLPW